MVTWSSKKTRISTADADRYNSDSMCRSSGGARVFAAGGKGLWCHPSNRQRPSSVVGLESAPGLESIFLGLGLGLELLGLGLGP